MTFRGCWSGGATMHAISLWNNDIDRFDLNGLTSRLFYIIFEKKDR